MAPAANHEAGVRRRERWSDLKVGIFVLVALAVVVTGSLWIAGGRLFAARHVSYDVLLADSGGVVAGDRVRVAGVAVGRIQDVVLRPDDEWPVLMRISVDEKIDVYQDASATIASSGILGTSFLQIDPGSRAAPRLAPGSSIQGEASAGMEDAFEQVAAISQKLLEILEQASGLLDQVSTEIGPVMARLQALLSEENAENLEAILAEARSTLEQVSPRVGPLLDRLDAVAGTMEEAIEGVPALTEQTSSLIADLETALGPDGERLALLLDGAATTMGSADEAMRLVLENRASIEATLRDLETTMTNLRAFSDRVKQQPSSLLRSSPLRERRPGDPLRERRRDEGSGGSR
ncbi:MAG TPA: MlaD family protein [Thermoanaerobaculia bacterium]|nr:MlaD family protein [Thermoanaerobaculia bacterium]